MNKLSFLLAGLLLIIACRKQVDKISNPDSQLGFFNVSEYVQGQLLNSAGQASIMIDAPDSTFPRTGNATPATLTPYFANGTYFYAFPSTNNNYSTQPQPWISYMRISQGTHTITLTDTGNHHSLISTRIQTASGLPVTLYYSDSLGYFRGYVLRDTVNESTGNIQLRVFDLSPDAGKVFFTIGGHPVTGFPDSLQYGQITDFTAWANPVFDTLQIRFYNVGDTTDVLASTALDALPGHAYNLILTGYKKTESFKDPISGRFLSYNPDIKIVLTQNN